VVSENGKKDQNKLKIKKERKEAKKTEKRGVS